MLEVLHSVEKELPSLLSRDDWIGFRLDHEPPFIDRLLRPYRDGKLLLHRIHPSETALYHRHPWPSAMRLVEGSYELTLGPITKIVHAPFEYEMTDPLAGHAVRPIETALTVMVTGPRWSRPPRSEEAAPLPEGEIAAMLQAFRRYY
jgi:hypothetical protein